MLSFNQSILIILTIGFAQFQRMEVFMFGILMKIIQKSKRKVIFQNSCPLCKIILKGIMLMEKLIHSKNLFLSSIKRISKLSHKMAKFGNLKSILKKLNCKNCNLRIYL